MVDLVWCIRSSSVNKAAIDVATLRQFEQEAGSILFGKHLNNGAIYEYTTLVLQRQFLERHKGWTNRLSLQRGIVALHFPIGIGGMPGLSEPAN